MQKQSGEKSLHSQRVAALALTLAQNESLWPALLAGLGAFFLLALFPFYNIFVALLLAIGCGAIAYSRPQLGFVFSLVLSLPAIAYQAPALAWLYCILAIGIISAMESFKEFFKSNWRIFPILQISICAPFFPLFPLGAAAYVALAFGALLIGSKNSLFISIPSVLGILLLSSLWLVPNTALLPISHNANYLPSLDGISRSANAEPSIISLPVSIISSLIGMFSWQALSLVPAVLGKFAINLSELLIADSAIIQLIAWGAALYAIGYLPVHIKNPYSQSIAALSMLAIPAANFAISLIYNIEFEFLSILYAIFAIACLFYLDISGMKISVEDEIESKEKQKQFGKFGIEDMGASGGPSSLKDVGGYEDVKEELLDSIAVPLQNKEISATYHIKPVAGILLFGPPGTGKTLIVSALAKELKFGFYYIKCSDLLSSWYGESERNVTELFQIARTRAPCILFFDEIDALAKRRDKYLSDDVSPRVLSVILTEMDGFKTKHSKPVIIIGATNAPNALDPAIMRPGRLDKIIYMHLPDLEARKKILQVHLAKYPKSDDIDLEALAHVSEGYSGADLANVVQEAVRLAAREARSKDKIVPVSQTHLVSILRKVRPSTGERELNMYDQFRDEFERSTRGA